MNLALVVQVFQILGPLIIAISVVIGIIQLREFQRQRREVAAIEVVHSFRSSEFTRALRMVWALPAGISPHDLRARGPEYEDAAVFVGTTMEAIGVLVYRRIVPIEILDELMGDAIVGFWPRLEPWIIEQRGAQARQSFYEWFQWLVERLQERERRTREGAHTKYRDWRP